MTEDILSTTEIDQFIEDFEVSKLDEIGKKRWFSKNAIVVKLYQIAILEAAIESIERVKDAVERYGKVEYFINELITLFVWKEKVYPELMKIKPEPSHSMPTYIVLYYEVALVGLLQSFLYHSSIFHNLEDSCIDIIDYCVNRLTKISADDLPIHHKSNPNATAFDEIERHDKEIKFSVSTNCISLLRYICENLENLPMSVSSRIYSTHDVPILIANLIDSEIWSKRDQDDGKLYKFCDNRWREWFSKDPPLSKVEVQVWLLIRELLLNTVTSTLYYFSNYRKEQFSKLVRHLHDKVIDQLSPLSDLKYWLHMNSLSSDEGPRVHNPLIMEVTKQFKDYLIDEYNGKWNDIALDRSKLLFYPEKTELQFVAKGFSDYLDNLEKMEDNVQTCMNCHKKAIKKCSKCKQAYYCGRKCQVEHWPAHKNICR